MLSYPESVFLFLHIPKLNHTHFFLCHIPRAQNKLTIIKKKFPIAHIFYHLKIQSSVLAFEQKRLHQLGNSFDGKYVIVFQQAVFGGWLTHFTHQSAMHGFEV